MKKLFLGLALALISTSAMAATWAHIESGYAMDPVDRPSANLYLKLYSPEITHDWQVVEVPAGTQHGAKAKGDGTYIDPPAPPPPQKVPVPLTESDFIQLVQTAGGMTDQQLVACKKDPNYEALWIKFEAAPSLNRDDPRVRQGLDALAMGGYIPKGAAAVITAWPIS